MPDDSRSYRGIMVESFGSKCVYKDNMPKYAFHDKSEVLFALKRVSGDSRVSNADMGFRVVWV